MMKDIEGLNDIILFTDQFYNVVREDDLIGPIFNKAVADWSKHLPQMYAFWNAALFGVAGFKGNPFAKHAPLPISKEHFERWLALFDETINGNFTGPMADGAKRRAVMMAELFLNRLERLKGDTTKVVY